MRHAILIMAHNNFSVISALLEQLDAPEFDFYIHINAKVRAFPKQEWEATIHRAGLYFVPRVKVGYCDYSMVEAVVSLLKAATTRRYDYYHLVSGSDLCIKRRDVFLRFFEEYQGREFVGFSSEYEESRVCYRHFFTALGRQPSHFWSARFIKLRKALIWLQKTAGLRQKITHFAVVKKGTDWYSITDGAARYMLEREADFRLDFYYAYCPTEFFPQTVLYNSSFSERFYDIDREGRGCLRVIDWERGSPYTFTMADKDLLQKSDGVFARKFDEKTDMKIVSFLRDYVKG